MPRDILANKAARASTPVPGHWLIDLPSLSPHIHVRCYKLDQPTDQGGSIDEILSGAQADLLERAWKQVDGGELGFEKGVAGVLEGGCAAVVAAQDGPRELWCFTVGKDGEVPMEDPLRGIEGLSEVILHPQSFRPADLIDCRKHGSDTSCLATQNTTENACEVGLTANEDYKKWWRYFGDAIYEKLAWRSGRRVPLRYGGTAVRPVDIGLHPMPHDKLLFTVTARSPLLARRTVQQPRAYILHPLNLPALPLGPRQLTPAEDAHLSSRFETALGHTWKAGRPQLQLDSQIHDREYADWSMYWVPTNPLDLSGRWQDGQGVMTIWPTHLARDLSNGSGSITTPARPTPALFDFPQDTDLLSTATDLFEHLSSIHDHPVSPTHTTAQATTPLDTVIGESPPFEYDENPPTSPFKEESVSDMDDLFSAGSESPGPPEPLEDIEEIPDQTVPVNVPMIVEGAGKEVVERVDMNEDVLMASPPRYDFAGPPPATVQAQEEANMVTEDDFDFFDSPKPDVPVDTVIFDEEVTEGPETGQAVRDVELADAEGDDLLGDEDGAIAEGGPSEVQPIEVGQSSSAADDPDAEMPDSLVLPQSPMSDEVEITTVDANYPPISVQDPIYTSHQADIIPSDFEPIQLSSSSSLYPFTPYAPPTPAPTPPGLRSSLLARLRPPKVEKLDYAADWDVSSAGSETEEEDEGYTPPTPISEVDTEDDVPVKDVVTKARGGSDGQEVEWEGLRCVGSEWVVLGGERGVLEKLARPWNTSWNVVYKNDTTSTTPALDVKQEGKFDFDRIDLDKFACELINNRSIRKIMIPTQLSEHDNEFEEPLAQLGIDLAILNGLAPDTSTQSIYRPHALPECLVHAGYANYVMQLMSSGLRYWRELGLQPVGGRKDITGLVVCDVGEGNVRAARLFLTRMGTVFEGYRLGTHKVGETPGAKDGVVSLPENAFADSISGILSRQPENTVIYVLGSELKMTLYENLQRITSTTKTTLIHYIHPSFLQPRNIPTLAFEIYDRLLVPLRPVSDLDPPSTTHLPHPHFTLAPDDPPKVELTLEWPIRNYEVLNRWRWVHCAYSVDWERRVGVAFVVDENGEGWEVKVWKAVSGGRGFVEGLWEWMVGVGDGWAVEWRGSVCCLGGMRGDEEAAWRDILPSKRIPITLLVVETPISYPHSQHAPRPPTANAPSTIYADPITKINNDSLSAHTFAYSFRIPIPLLLSPGTTAQQKEAFIPKTTFLLSIASSRGGLEYGSTKYHVLQHRSAKGRQEENVESVLAREFHKLTCLGRGRFGLEGYLPGHLEVVRMVLLGLGEFVGTK